ncbi:MAG TPA: Dabb family protein [Chthoniobacteraceae bacterium]|nr:Dabb family protein [Chthoniobacteraceae bacterium]
MVHHIVLFKLKPEVNNDKIETMMMSTRMMLLKIPEALSVKCGKKINPAAEWPFFIAVDCESMDKLALCLDDPIYLKFTEEIIKPNTIERLALDYEMEPGKEVKYS